LVSLVCQVNLLYFIFVELFWFCLWVYIPHIYTYMYIFSHILYCCYKPLPLCWAFAVLWSFLFFPFFLSSSFIWTSVFLDFSFICTISLCLSLFFFLTYCVWGLFFPGFKENWILSFKKFEFFLPFGFCPPKAGPVVCVSFV